MTSFITDFDMRARRPNRSWNWLWLASIAFTALLVSLTYEKLQYEAHNTRRNMVSVDTSDNIDEFRLLMGNTTKAPTVSPGEQCFTSKTNGPVQGKACKLPFLYKHNASDPGVVVEECVSVEQYVPFGAESFDIQPNATLWCATTFATYIADESETQGLWGICSCTQAPTKAPSASPTTLMPTPLPTVLPTFAPTTAPTIKPTVSPTPRPTLSCAVVPVLSKPLLSQYLTNVFWPALEDRYNAQTGTNTSIKIAENGEFCQFPFRYNGTDSFDCIDERNTIDVNNTVKFRWCVSDESEGELTAGVCGCGTVTEPPAPPPTLLPTAAPQTGSPTGSPSKFPTKAPTTAPTIYSFAVFSFDGLVISSRVQDERNLLERYSEELTMYNSKDGLRSTYQDPYRRNDVLSTRIPPRSSGDSLTKHPNQQKRTSGDMYVDDAQSNYGTLSNHRLLMDSNDTDSKNVTSPPSSVGNSTAAPTTSPTTLPTSTPTKSPIPHPSTSPTFAPVVVPTKLPTPHPSTVGATVGYCTLQCHITRLFEEFLAVEVDGYRKAEGFGDLVDYNWKDDFVTEVILAGPGADSSCTRLCKLKISIVVIPVQRPEPPRTMDPLIGGINSTMTPTSSPTGTQFKINSETADIFVKKSLGQLVSKGSKLYRIIVNGLEFTQLNEGETPIDEERIVEPPLLLCEKVCIGSIFTLQPTTSPTIAASDEPATQDPGGDTAVIAATSVSVTVLVGLILFCFCRPRSLHEKSSNRGVLHTCFGTCCPRCFGDFNEGTNQSDGSKQPLGGGGGSNVADSFHPYDDTSQSKVAPSHNSGSNSFDELNIELSKLSIKHIIGHGGNGRIFKALYCGSSVAVKELFPEGQDKNAQFGRIPIAFMREMQILRKLRHPHIIQLYGCSTANDQDTGELRYLLVMELAKHSLKDLLECNCLSRAEASHQASRDSLHLTGQQPPPTPGACSLDGSDCVSVRSAKSPMKSPSVIAGGGRLTSNSIGSAQAAREDDSMLLSLSRKYKLAQQICAGCAYIHDNNMVHFDIKPGNILLDFAGNAKICDLGIAKLNMNPNDNANFTASAFGGTPPYMAPELLRGDTSRINKAVDVYAFGIILWQLFHDRPSHPRTWTVARLFNEVMVHDYRPPLDMENPEVVPVAHLIKACWDKDSENRPDFHTLLHRLSVISQIVNEGGRKDDAGGKVWQLGESVQCWAPSIKSYSLGRIVVAHADGTYNVHFDDPSLPARLLVHPTDLLPEDDARNQHKLMQQTISGLAITNIAVRNHVLQSNHRGSMQHLRLPQTSMMSIDTNPSALGHSMMNQSALSALSFTFVRKVDQNPNGKPDRNLSLGIDGVISTMGSESIGTRHNLTLGTDTSQMQSLDETFKFDGSILQMPGFFVTGEGVEFGDDGSNASVSGQSFKSGASYWESSLIQINKLGHGASGTVRVALHIPTFEIVAVKQIRFAERNVRHQMVRELKVLWKNMIGVRKAREEQLKRVKTASHDDTDGVEDNVAHSTPTLLTNPSNVKLPKSVPEDLELIPSPVVESNENTDDGDVEFGGCEQIVLLHDAYLDAETQSVNLVLEYMNGGSLQDLVDAMQEDECNLEYIEEKVMSRITRDILLAIRFLHRNHLLHLDIKPANVLVNLNGEAKLADFGLARQLEESGHFKATTFKGSARYMSPERLKGEAYSYPSDIWSLGLTLMTCVLGRYPIESSGVNREVFSDTSRGSGSSPETHSQGTPAKPRQPRKQQGTMAYWELLSQLENEANVRLETYDVDNKFTPELKSFLRCCLVVDPDERGTAEYLLQHPWIVQFQHSSKSSTGVGKLPLGSWRSERESDTETDLVGVNATAGSCLLSDDDDLAPGASGQSADSWMAPMSSPESVPSKKSTELDSGDEVDGERVEAAKYLLEDITKHVVQQLSQSPEKMSMFSGLNVAQLRPGVDNELPLSTSRVEHLAQQLGLPAKLVEAKFEEAAIALRYPTVDDAESMRAARVVDTMPPQGNGSGSVSPKRWNKMKDEGSLTTSEIVVNSELSPSLNLPSGPVEPEKSSRKYRKPRQSSDSSWSQRSASSFSSPLAKVLSKVTGGNKSKGKSDEPSQEDLSEEGKVAAPGSILGTLT